MERNIREFISYLHNAKRTTYNTEVSYQRDLKKMVSFLSQEEDGISSKSVRILLSRKSILRMLKALSMLLTVRL